MTETKPPASPYSKRFTVHHLLPDENEDEFASLTSSLLQDLAPHTAYEKLLAQNLIRIEHDIIRHRRLLAASIQSSFDREATGVYTDGRPGLENFFWKKNPERDKFIQGLRSNDPAERAHAEKILIKNSVTRSEITASAFEKAEHMVSYHEARLSELECRRRKLLKDYETLQARNRSQKQENVSSPTPN